LCIEKIIEKIKPQNLNCIFWLSSSVGVIIGIVIALSDIRFSAEGYYYTLSSIVQGLFAILALAGIFVVFQVQRFDGYIDIFDGGIRKDINDYFIKKPGKANKIYFGRNEPQKIFDYLESRNMEKYLEILHNIKYKIPNDPDKYLQEILAYKRCCHKGFLIFLYRTKRDCMLKCLKYPIIHGIMIIILSILFLPLLTTEKSYTVPLISSNISLIPMELVLMVLVFGSISVIFETFYVIHLSIWRDFPRYWQNGYSKEKSYDILKEMKRDDKIYKPCLEIIDEKRHKESVCDIGEDKNPLCPPSRKNR